MGCNRKCFEFADGRESLLAAFVVCRSKLSFLGESKIFKAVHHLDSFIVDAGGIVGGAVGCAVTAGSVN